mgnify:FL=1|jgi:hypothetical protein|tara:strand:- start:2254 stop:2628 length:375 start_codon:yes stop_codon:yes gene_type:complete
MSYFIGTSPEAVVNGFIKRYFYGLRRNDDGELFLIRIDQLAGDETAVINDVGIGENNFLDYEEGIDFLEGVDIDHNVVYQNLRYPQLKWDSRLLTYYVDPVDGQYIISISQDYEYPENISSPGY